MITGRSIGYNPKIATTPRQATKLPSNYIKIGQFKYNYENDLYFDFFNFKLNKRGGESGRITFTSPNGTVNLQDEVVLVVDNASVFEGFIDREFLSGSVFDILPTWGKLDNVYTEGVLEVEITDTVENIIALIRPKIESVGIIYDATKVIIPSGVQVTLKLVGNSIRQILDELEDALPESIAWGVDGVNDFYFMSFSEFPTVEKRLDWYQGAFSKSTYSIDYGNIFSSYLVKVKQLDGESFKVLPLRVGAVSTYPPLPFNKFVGDKTGIFEIPFYISDNLAYEMAYNNLKNQFPIEKVSMSTMNRPLEINTAYRIILEPVSNNFLLLDGGGGGVIVSNFVDNSDIMDIGGDIEFETTINISAIDFSIQKIYQEMTNRSLRLSRIIGFFKSEKEITKFTLSDGVNSVSQFSNGNLIDFKNLEEFDKRKIIITFDILGGVIVDSVQVFFEQGSLEKLMNLTEITYAYNKGVMNVNATGSKLNAESTRYFWKQNQDLATLNSLLTGV